MSGLELIGALVGAVGTIAGGVAEKRNADFEAQQMEMKAKEETAAAQRDAESKRREGVLINSRAQALAAASGAGAGDDAPTIVKLMSQTSSEADYNARSSLYGGYSRSAGLNDSAKGRRASGKASLLGSVFGGLGQAAGAFGTYKKNKAFG
jgi:hypothetical protein